MSLFQREENTIPEGKYRVIKIGKDALAEFIYESIMDNLECFFDITDGTKIVTGCEINWDAGELICVARNVSSENERLQFDIDVNELMLKLQNTTNTMYAENRYIELSKEDIRNL